MFNIVEQPWFLLAASFISLVIIYAILLDRKLYWMSLLILSFSTSLFLITDANILNFFPLLATILKVSLPVAITVLVSLIIIEIVRIRERSYWLWLIPIILCGLAFGLDFFIQTDNEKIKTVINTGIRAVEQENCNTINNIISSDYRDSYHHTKQELMQHCRSTLSRPLIDKITRTSQQVEISGREANVIMAVIVLFDKQSVSVEAYGVTAASATARVQLRKEAGNKWLISEVEVTEVNGQPIGWNAINL